MYNQDEYRLLDISSNRLSKHHPIHTYSVKKDSLRRFVDNDNRDFMIKRMQPIIIDIFKLYDKIEKTFPDTYNKTGKKYGSKKYSRYNDGKCVGKSCFYGDDLYYGVPDGIMYPLLSAFRSIVGIDNETGFYYWTKNPLETWDSLKDELVSIVSNNANLDNIPIVGKDYSLWDSLLKTVYFYTLQ